jgi:hypothetical protein
MGFVRVWYINIAVLIIPLAPLIALIKKKRFNIATYHVRWHVYFILEEGHKVRARHLVFVSFIIAVEWRWLHRAFAPSACWC